MLLALMIAVSGQVRLEAEDASLTGATVSSSRPGYSGKGYATGFTLPGARAEWKVKVRGGIYLVDVGFSTPGGEKGFEVQVNGRKVSAHFPDSKGAFNAVSAGRMELANGENVVSIERGWGHYDLDFVELKPAPAPPPLKRISKRLADPRASSEARQLYANLVNSYGKSMLSGQYGLEDSEFLRKQLGVYPAIFGEDFMDFSPSRVERGANPAGDTERAINRAKAGSILTYSWHWNAPSKLLDKEIVQANGQKIDARWYKGFYTNATTFDVAAALQDPASEDYRLLVRDIDAIAVELKKLSDAKVPILWRPLHEADGGWFWWGAKGPAPCIKLWQLLFDRLTNHHRLHNLIWVWNSTKDGWYPGDDVVDIVSIDSYPSDKTDPLSAQWEDLLARYNGKKLLAISEIGGVPDVARMPRFGVRWSYFVSWTGSHGPRPVAPTFLKRA